MQIKALQYLYHKTLKMISTCTLRYETGQNAHDSNRFVLAINSL